MPRRTAPLPPPDDFDPSGTEAEPEIDEEAVEAGEAPARPDLSSVPIAGLTRRRMAWLAAGFATVWIVIAFGRQVGEASAAVSAAHQAQVDNAALQQRVDSLQREAALIQQPAYIAQQARAYRLGSPNEIPFTLAADAPTLPPDAPGSVSVRLGAATARQSPLDSWLSLLFGPGD